MLAFVLSVHAVCVCGCVGVWVCGGVGVWGVGVCVCVRVRVCVCVCVCVAWVQELISACVRDAASAHGGFEGTSSLQRTERSLPARRRWPCFRIRSNVPWAHGVPTQATACGSSSSLNYFWPRGTLILAATPPLGHRGRPPFWEHIARTNWQLF